MRLETSLVVIVASLSVVGCQDRSPTIFPNADGSLNRRASEIAVESMACFPYPAGLPAGGEIAGRAEVGYSWNQIHLLNMSGQEWKDVELWVNKSYVVQIPVVEDRVLKRVPFKVLFDQAGGYFPLNNSKVRVSSVQIKKDGVMYDMSFQIGD